MLNIAIVEDDPRAAGLLVSYLDRYAQERAFCFLSTRMASR